MSGDELAAGLRDLNAASKLLFIASLLGIVPSVILFTVILALLTFTPLHAKISSIYGFFLVWLPLTAVAVVLLVASAIISLYAIYAKLLPSSRHFARWMPANFEAPRKLLYVGYWGALVLALLALASGVALLASVAPLFTRGPGLEELVNVLAVLLVPLVLLVLAAILLFVGFVGEVMLFYELGTALASRRFKHVALLTIAYFIGSIFVSLVPAFIVTVPLSIVVAGLQAVAYYLAMEESSRLLASLPSQQPALQV